MHVCPVDCNWCAEPRCRADGCALANSTSEAVLLPCTGCGTLTIIRARVHFCTPCIADGARNGDVQSLIPPTKAAA